MAKTLKEKSKNLKSKKPSLWSENKIERIRSLLKPYASRASRAGKLGGIGILFVLILSSFFLPKDQFEKNKEGVLKNPQDLETRLALTEELLKNNQIKEAEKEILEIEKLSQLKTTQNQVLGSSSWFEDLKKKWQESDQEELEKLIREWERVTGETPTYRDGYLYLSFYYYKLGNREKAQENLKKAKEIDRDLEATKELENIIKDY